MKVYLLCVCSILLQLYTCYTYSDKHVFLFQLVKKRSENYEYEWENIVNDAYENLKKSLQWCKDLHLDGDYKNCLILEKLALTDQWDENVSKMVILQFIYLILQKSDSSYFPYSCKYLLNLELILYVIFKLILQTSK